MLLRVAHDGGCCAAILGARPPVLVIHFSTRVQVAIRSTLDISLNVWRQVFHVYWSKTRHRHRNDSAVSDAKYRMFFDMASVRIHGTSELEVGKEKSTDWSRRPKTARVMVRMDSNTAIQGIWSMTKCNAKLKWQTHFGLVFQSKITSKIVKKPTPRSPNGLQNPLWRPLGRPSWKQYVFEGLEDASRISFGKLLGSPKAFQSRYRSASNTLLISKSVLEGFWDVLNTNF